jgi:hypothetical protein
MAGKGQYSKCTHATLWVWRAYQSHHCKCTLYTYRPSCVGAGLSSILLIKDNVLIKENVHTR